MSELQWLQVQITHEYCKDSINIKALVTAGALRQKTAPQSKPRGGTSPLSISAFDAEGTTVPPSPASPLTVLQSSHRTREDPSLRAVVAHFACITTWTGYPTTIDPREDLEAA